MGKRLYYVYKITNKISHEFYIGYRGTTLKNPLNDLGVKYFTSGALKSDFEKNPENYTKQILFESHKERLSFWTEQRMIMNVFYNPLCKNRHYSAKVEKQTLDSLVNGKNKIKNRNNKKHISAIKNIRIWSDIEMKFVDVSHDEYERLKNAEKANKYSKKRSYLKPVK